MASLEFRPPQFSEDLAWLPTWLQNHHQIETLTNNSTTQLQSSSIEEASRNNNSSSNNFNLFLSGDSQMTVSPSPVNVVHFCLRLSLDGEESHQSESHDLNISQPLAQRVETSALEIVEGQNRDKVANCKDIVETRERFNVKSMSQPLAKQVETSAVEFNGENGENINCNKDNVEIGERLTVKGIKDADVNEAVELSIAASEALVIHELMSTSEVVSTGAILEAALQVKKARLEGFEDGNCCSFDETDEINVLSDLDDSVMEDAFLDVGFSFSDIDDQCACGSDVSQVKDTPVDSQHVQVMVHHDEISNGSALGLNSNNVAGLVDPLPPQPADAIPYVPSIAQPQVDVSSSPACMAENSEGEEIACSLVADKSRSRWLGGWTLKEADTSAKLKQNHSKGVPKLFDCETSFLSESAYVAADENSCVQKRETESKLASQSSVRFEGVLDKADEEIFVSQEARSSNQSLVDPLCSVVPCSISSENAGSLLAQNHDDREANAQNCFSTRSECMMENFEWMSDVNVEPPYVDMEAVRTITGESFEAPVQRHLASLKTYSTLLPKHEAILEGKQLNHNQLLSSEYAGGLISPMGSFDQMNTKLFLPLRTEINCSTGTDHGQNQDVNTPRSPLSDHDEPAKDGTDWRLQPSMQRRSPLVLNRRTCCRLQPSELIVKNITGDKSPEQIVAQGTISKALQREHIQKIESKLKNPHSMPNFVRKRVSFLEVEVGFQQDKDGPKAQISQRNSLATRANKRPKYSKPQSGSRIQDVKSCFKGRINDVKRLIFHGLQFLLTGFSSRNEKEVAGLIQECGGIVLLDVPSPPSNSRTKRSERANLQQLPIVICSKKLKTTKVLYGCAVNAPILKVKWLTDSVAAGSIVPPEKYMIISNQARLQSTRYGNLGHHDPRRIFDRVGIMLHGKPSFCTKLAIIIKHGGGQVFKTLQRLFHSLDTKKIYVGAIVAEDESRISRHLRHCASERKLPMMPASWMAKSLHSGKLLTFQEKDNALTIEASVSATSLDWSQEI